MRYIPIMAKKKPTDSEMIKKAADVIRKSEIVFSVSPNNDPDFTDVQSTNGSDAKNE